MSCLFYCICRQSSPEVAGLVGVGDHPVYRITHRRLGAAVSCIGPADLAPDLTRVRAYARVVNSYHRQGTVIPLRYGSVVAQETLVNELLDEYNRQYESLLQELEGCVEMGLRVMLPAAFTVAQVPGRLPDRRP